MQFFRRIFQSFADYRITRFFMRVALAFVSPRNYVGAVAVVFNDRGEILLAQHSYRTDYEWGLPGGWVARGENPADTVIREIAEELRLDVTVERLLICDKVPAVRRSTAPPHIGLAYLCRAVGGEVRTSHEIVSVEWVEPSRVARKLAPFQMEAIEVAAKAEPYAGPPHPVTPPAV
jgi:8-oxo-dGTP diphosphatase